MLLDKNLYKLEFYQKSPKGRVLRAMTLNDITFWASDAFISVIIVLFVIQFIEGGSATHLGLSLLLYKAVEAFSSISIGKFFDKHKGKLDEVYGLALANFTGGTVYVALSFGSELWHLYLAMVFLGLIASLNKLSWRTLFYGSIKHDEYSESVAIYQTFMAIGTGLALGLAGFVGDIFGFEKVVFYGGLVIFIGGFLPLSIRYFVERG